MKVEMSKSIQQESKLKTLALVLFFAGFGSVSFVLAYHAVRNTADRNEYDSRYEILSADVAQLQRKLDAVLNSPGDGITPQWAEQQIFKLDTRLREIETRTDNLKNAIGPNADSIIAVANLNTAFESISKDLTDLKTSTDREVTRLDGSIEKTTTAAIAIAGSVMVPLLVAALGLFFSSRPSPRK